jgi:hypothetical protein
MITVAKKVKTTARTSAYAPLLSIGAPAATTRAAATPGYDKWTQQRDDVPDRMQLASGSAVGPRPTVLFFRLPTGKPPLPQSMAQTPTSGLLVGFKITNGQSAQDSR